MVTGPVCETDTPVKVRDYGTLRCLHCPCALESAPAGFCDSPRAHASARPHRLPPPCSRWRLLLRRFRSITARVNSIGFTCFFPYSTYGNAASSSAFSVQSPKPRSASMWTRRWPQPHDPPAVPHGVRHPRFLPQRHGALVHSHPGRPPGPSLHRRLPVQRQQPLRPCARLQPLVEIARLDNGRLAVVEVGECWRCSGGQEGD